MSINIIAPISMHDRVYIVWEIPHDKITGYEIYRDNVMIASSVDGDDKIFVPPTLFDRDFGTNLFRKSSTKQLMYIDENVQRYQNYSYRIVAKIIRNNKVTDIDLGTGYVQVQ